MIDVGVVSLVLGMEVTGDCDRGTVTVSQKLYTKSILERFGMDTCNPLSTTWFGSELSTE